MTGFSAPHRRSRRDFLAASGAAGLQLLAADRAFSGTNQDELAADDDKALIGITLDLEMSRYYPTRDITEWDYQKGNLNDETKQYTVEACRRVKAKGGVLHSFVVGQVLEHRSVDWLKEIANEGHPIGNHTYDHVNITATESKDIQYRFQRSPWLIRGKGAADVISENIRMCEFALKQRTGIQANGFRTPGGFGKGLSNRPDLQEMMLKLGYGWLSSKAIGVSVPRRNPTMEHHRAIVASQAGMQPFVYPSGLIEIPFAPMMDVGFFRSRRWKLSEYLTTVEMCVNWAIENRAVYDWGTHPSVMYVEDPEFKTVELICDVVNASGGKAAVVGLDTIARRFALRAKQQNG